MDTVYNISGLSMANITNRITTKESLIEIHILQHTNFKVALTLGHRNTANNHCILVSYVIPTKPTAIPTFPTVDEDTPTFQSWDTPDERDTFSGELQQF